METRTSAISLRINRTKALSDGMKRRRGHGSLKSRQPVALPDQPCRYRRPTGGSNEDPRAGHRFEICLYHEAVARDVGEANHAIPDHRSWRASTFERTARLISAVRILLPLAWVDPTVENQLFMPRMRYRTHLTLLTRRAVG